MVSHEPTFTAAQWHKQLAVQWFNETWALLEKPDRTAEDDDRMIHMAHASRLHWELVGTSKNITIGEWLVSRVHATLKQADAALYHAERCLHLAAENKLGDFHIAYGHEAMARALAITGNRSAIAHLHIARTVAAHVIDPEERKLLDDDLATIDAE